MKKTTIIIGTCVAALIFLAGCGAATQPALDDTWAIEEIRGGDLITANVDDFLAVSFDVEADTATITIGPDWGTLSAVDVSGTFAFVIDAANTTITLSQNGEARYTIIYDLSDDLQSMQWMEWVDVDADPNVQIVGSDAIIDYISFARM